MKRVLLGVCASIASYKAALLVRQLRARAVEVQVMLTPMAARMVGAPTFRALSGQVVLQDEWTQPQSADGMDHIAAVRRADMLLIAPASADFIAKAAAGIADTLPLTAFLAADCPKYIAPAMNQQMWAAAATQRNIQQLRADGVQVLGPAVGEQACGESGPGRLLEVEDIVAALLDGSPQTPTSTQPFAGQRVVVSTGATVEPLDAMRVISNRSSGQMGFCLARAAADLGAQVRVVAAQTSSPPPVDIPLRRAVSGDEMREALLEETETADWFFSVAAVADFRAAAGANGTKTKAAREDGEWTVVLQPTTDILSEVAQARPRLRCLAFAAQSGTAASQLDAARTKMKRKGARFIALNDVADAGADDSQLTLLFDGGEITLPRLPKLEAARELLTAMVSRETRRTE